ncbi:hypothetical protein GCM10022232_25460 [Streptomyces plumbiresistens]|uniref:Uncharacterized protein n=1 Tax=Streptomyces plumbiresistens TaxID=511811 RepID=A0ABP7QZI0_9ACTN
MRRERRDRRWEVAATEESLCGRVPHVLCAARVVREAPVNGASDSSVVTDVTRVAGEKEIDETSGDGSR